MIAKRSGASAEVYGIVQGQAAILAFNNIYRMLAALLIFNDPIRLLAAPRPNEPRHRIEPLNRRPAR